MLEKIVSGGDTGVDRAALDVAPARDAVGELPPVHRMERARLRRHGTLKTLHYALERHRKPALVLQLHRRNEGKRVRCWLRRGIYREARRLLLRIFNRL